MIPVTVDSQNHHLEAAERERQHFLKGFIFFVSLTIPVVSAFALFHLFAGRSGQFASILPLPVVLVVCRILVTRTRHEKIIYLIAILGLYLHFLRLLYVGAEYGSNLVWMLCFPISAFLLLGRKNGILVMALSLLGIVLVFYGPPVGFIEKYDYPTPVKARFLIVYMVIALVSLWYENIRLSYRNEMEQRHLELLDANQKIEQLSVTDKLTHCYNRHYLEEEIRQELDRGKRYAHSLAIILCDVDRFKAVNDEYGHTSGDRVLAELAAILRGSVRDGVDWVVRYGGEEFLIILPESDLSDATSLASRIRARFLSKPLAIQNNALNITASFGVTAVQLESSSEIEFHHLFERVDKLLYRAKADGRNRIVFSEYASSQIESIC